MDIYPVLPINGDDNNVSNVDLKCHPKITKLIITDCSDYVYWLSDCSDYLYRLSDCSDYLYRLSDCSDYVYWLSDCSDYVY